jgi:ribose 5-phosphate isomerase B
MRIAIGSDHGGWHLKEEMKELIQELGHEVKDYGCETPDRCDYPDYAKQVAISVAKGEFDRGILVCGTGIGMSIAANKIPGIRAAVCSDTFSARFSRLHNDANILCLGERVVGPGLAGDLVTVWLGAGFEGERHAPRVQKIMDLERLPDEETC